MKANKQATVGILDFFGKSRTAKGLGWASLTAILFTMGGVGIVVVGELSSSERLMPFSEMVRHWARVTLVASVVFGAIGAFVSGGRSEPPRSLME